MGGSSVGVLFMNNPFFYVECFSGCFAIVLYIFVLYGVINVTTSCPIRSQVGSWINTFNLSSFVSLALVAQSGAFNTFLCIINIMKINKQYLVKRILIIKIKKIKLKLN